MEGWKKKVVCDLREDRRKSGYSSRSGNSTQTEGKEKRALTVVMSVMSYLPVDRQEATAVPRYVELRHHSNAPVAAVGNHGPDIVLRVVPSVYPDQSVCQVRIQL